MRVSHLFLAQLVLKVPIEHGDLRVALFQDTKIVIKGKGLPFDLNIEECQMGESPLLVLPKMLRLELHTQAEPVFLDTPRSTREKEGL